MPVGLPHELGASHSGDGLEHVGEMWPGTEAHRLGKRFQGRSTFPVVFEKYPASLLDAELFYEVTACDILRLLSPVRLLIVSMEKLGSKISFRDLQNSVSIS